MKCYECYPSYACNARCVFCFTPPRGKADIQSRRGLSFGQLVRRMYSSYQNGSRSLRLLGGEPTVRPDIVKLCLAAKKMGYRDIFMFTNGLRLADPVFAGRLHDAGLSHVNLSVHGSSPEIHDALTRTPSSFHKVLRAIEHLQTLGIPLSLICVVNKINYLSLSEYCAFFLNRGVRLFQFFFLRYQGHMRLPSPETSRISLSMSDAAMGIRRAFEMFRSRPQEAPVLEHFVPCILPGFERRMRDYHPGGEKEKARIREEYACVHPEGLNERVLDLAYRHRVHLSQCSDCALREGCPGVADDYVRIFGGAEFKPLVKFPEPYCASWGQGG